MAMRIIVIILFIGCLAGCRKRGFLDEPATTSLYIPSTLQDMQGLLDDEKLLSQTPGLGMISGDQFIMTDAFWNNLPSYEHNAHVWASEIFTKDEITDDWNIPYKQVIYANVILGGLPRIPVTTGNAALHDHLKGAALFTRAYANYELAQVFADVYDKATANTKPGIALRYTADISENPTRSTIQQTYDQILGDLLNAVKLLPSLPDRQLRNRPSKAAAWALLARV